jgi:hypothetical protein
MRCRSVYRGSEDWPNRSCRRFLIGLHQRRHRRSGNRAEYRHLPAASKLDLDNAAPLRQWRSSPLRQRCRRRLCGDCHRIEHRRGLCRSQRCRTSCGAGRLNPQARSSVTRDGGERKPSKWTTVALIFCRSGGSAGSARLITSNLVVQQITQCYRIAQGHNHAGSDDKFVLATRSLAKRDAGFGRACVKVSVPRLPAHVR